MVSVESDATHVHAHLKRLRRLAQSKVDIAGGAGKQKVAASGGTNANTNDRAVREIFIIHVGGTRCVTSSTDNIMKIRARITLTVEFIRGCIFIFLFYV